MSAGRFLNTPVASVPRQNDLIAPMFARGEGLPLNAAAVEALIEAAVGFSVHVGWGGVDRDIVCAQIAVLAEGARIASARYW